MPPAGKTKGYRTVYDPGMERGLSDEEKKTRKTKLRSFGTEAQSPPPDPRLAIANYTSGGAVSDKEENCKRLLRIAPETLKPYAYDKALTIGPGPPRQIVIHGFDPFTPESQLKFFFASFGDIAEFRNQTDPNTGSLLGICSIKYKDGKPVKGVSISAASAAKRAEKEGHRHRIGLTQVKVELDREGRKCRKYIEFTLKKARREMEKEAARHAPRTVSVAAESRGSSTPVPPPPPPPPAAAQETPPILVNAPKAPKGPAPKRERERELAGASEQPATTKERDTGRSVVESEPILAKIKRKPYIFISRDSVPVLGSTVPHLKKRFKTFDWREIRVDKTGYFVIFDDSKRGEDETVRCFKECNNGPMFTYNMAMECQQYGNPDYVRSPSPETQAVQSRQKEETDRLERWAAEDLEEEKKEKAADLDPVTGALEQLQLELRNKIMDDIKKRIVIPELYDRLDPARHAAKRRKLDIPDPTDNENKPPTLLLNKAIDTLSTATRTRNGRPLSHSKPLRPHDPNRGRQIPTNVYADPRRVKKRPAVRPVHARPLHYRLQHMEDDEDEDESDDDHRTPMTRDTDDLESRPLSRASRTSTPFSVSESIDLPTPAPKKRKLVHKEREIIPEEDQEIFAPHHKELLGDLIHKIPERMATRELELVVSTLPRDSKFEIRARNELHLRQRAKYDHEESPASIVDVSKTNSTTNGDKHAAQPGDLTAKPVKKDVKRKRPKSKKQIFEEREAERAAAKATEDTQIMEPGSQADDRDIDGDIDIDADIDNANENLEEEEEEERPQVEWAVSTGEPLKTVLDDDEVFLDIDGWKHIVKDEEDMRYLLQALEDEPAADIGDVTLWAWKQKEIKALNAGGSTAEARIQGYYVPNLSGCARTEGVKKILESEKSKYLPHRIRVQKQREAREAQALENPNAFAAAEAAAEAAKVAAAAKIASVATSRSNRANNRRLVNDINLQKQNLITTGGEADAIKFNALKKRKKHVKFDRSAIHGWGLYAMENIASNDLIIEYVGEKVRQKVADLREIKYDKQGIGSSYLFRMVDDEIIDATKKGGIARFINHSCTPNCTAKIIKVDGTRRIVIYALKDIAKNDELTYDYKFEREYGSDDRIPCLCGSVGCKGFLN
ncbi:hypothetical protein M436DRAFT_52965 [Aureobasidium namibiae CBS 147.97]|uniref:Histone-lysine N-methyltransferase, H3 lysine-4 specific n=1 Tax=Aureobasidium namibiae CBS 147.97 TaxID=1043004 RepID=A0A074WCW1_9PEZI|nr:uncharacterized protein M436DRAFT_52965 [Aureobasidium namibiae CBS 147.97]KEQ70793.1 hypothetical protein M436DRAFT_52965 [Aureobasidium namibiae CBS 147.97]